MDRLGHSVVGIAVAALVAGCSGGPDQDPRPEPDSDAAAPEPADFRVADMLAEVPASARIPDKPFTIYTGDITHANELGGFARPESAGSEEAPVWVSQLGGVGPGGPWPVFVPLDVPLATSSPADLVADELGWSVVDVERFMTYSTAPNETTTVAAGPFDEDTLAHLPQVEPGIRTAGEGPELSSELENVTPARPGGVPLRMAVDDGWIAMSPYTQAVADWLEGPAASLADDPVLTGMAELLDREGVYSAMFSTPTPLSRNLPLPVKEVFGFSRDDLPQFDTFAIGWALAEGQAEITVVYHVPDAAAVGETRDQVAARWDGHTWRGGAISDLVDLHDVRVSGDHVVVSLTPAGERGAEIVFQMQEIEELTFVTP